MQALVSAWSMSVLLMVGAPEYVGNVDDLCFSAMCLIEVNAETTCAFEESFVSL